MANTLRLTIGQCEQKNEDLFHKFTPPELIDLVLF